MQRIVTQSRKRKKIEIDYIGIVDMPLFSNIRNIQVH